MDDYRRANRSYWDERAPAHADSAGYGLDRFIQDPEHLSAVVRFDLPRLGDIRGLRGVHLQCHIGTDTISLSRLGARDDRAGLLRAGAGRARHLATAAGAHVDFVQSDLYAALDVLEPEVVRPRVHGYRCPVLAAGCPGLGARSWLGCCGSAAGCSSGKATRCCGHWPMRGRTTWSSSSIRTSSAPSRIGSRRRARMPMRTSPSRAPPITPGTTAWVRS